MSRLSVFRFENNMGYNVTVFITCDCNDLRITVHKWFCSANVNAIVDGFPWVSFKITSHSSQANLDLGWTSWVMMCYDGALLKPCLTAKGYFITMQICNSLTFIKRYMYYFRFGLFRFIYLWQGIVASVFQWYYSMCCIWSSTVCQYKIITPILFQHWSGKVIRVRLT